MDVSRQSPALSRGSSTLQKKKSQDHNSQRPSKLLEIPEAKKFAGQPLLSVGNIGSAVDGDGSRTQSRAALSMKEIEEAVELVSPGLQSENINLGAGISIMNRNEHSRLSTTNQAGFQNKSMEKHASAMNITMQNAAPGSAHSNMLAKHQPIKAYG